MAKNIVLCSDGTGNATVKDRGTNVYKLYEAVDLDVPPDEPTQVAFYDDGVGTGSMKLLRMLGGAFGYGFARNVRDLYTNLCRVYQPGDRIYLFGFSRGAYTVRALAGLIAACGVLKGDVLAEPELRSAVGNAYRVYRLRFRSDGYQEDATRQATEFRRHRDVYQPGDPVRIALIGVWDTVGAVGLPDDTLLKRTLWMLSGFRVPWFKHYRLGPIVDRACHALAIDDERQTFHPILWDEPAVPPAAPDGRGPRLEQVWFAGVHSNVGGGYVKHGMSLVTLWWMMRKAEHAGLRFSATDRQLYRERQNVHDKLYDSRSGLAFSYRYSPRDIAAIASKVGIERPQVHQSAFDRVGMRTEGYAPGNIPATSVVVGDDPTRVAKTQTAVSTALKAGLPLASAWFLKRVRQVGHLTALTCAILLALMAVLGGVIAEGVADTLAALFSVTGLAGLVWATLTVYPAGVALLIVGVVAGFLASWIARRKMQDDFAEVWRPVAKDLRPIP